MGGCVVKFVFILLGNSVNEDEEVMMKGLVGIIEDGVVDGSNVGAVAFTKQNKQKSECNVQNFDYMINHTWCGCGCDYDSCHW